MDFPCAEPILEAMRRRVDARIFGYGAPLDEAYFEALLSWYGRRMGWRLDPAALVYSPGIVPALGFLLDLLSSPGDGVIIQRPVYHPFANMISSHGRRLVNNPLVNRGGRYEMDFEDLERKAAEPGVKLMILCSPHNPVGRVWSEGELRRLGRICLDRGLYLVSDEIHGDLVRGGQRHVPLESLFPGEEARIITAIAPSKTFNLAGLQLSHVVLRDPDLRKSWKTYVHGRLGIQGPNSLAVAATRAAYAEGEPWLEEVLAYLDGNFAAMGDFYARRLPLAGYRPSEGSYLAWGDFRPYGLPESDLLRRFVREARVLVQGGSVFGPEGEGFVRMNLACARPLLLSGLERMAEVVAPRP